MKTLDEINKALSRREFHLVYMPTIRLLDSSCVGAETLIRWACLDKLIPPCDFIPVIENTPTSGTLTYWIIEQVAIELGQWLSDTTQVHIGINVPPELLGRGGLKYAAANSGLDKVIDKILLEVTERGFPDDLGLETLRSHNGKVKVAIDDFGAGDANLLQLSKLEADIIKIDKYFVDQITNEDDVPKIIRGLVGFAKGMGLEIIAEGVENECQFNVLKKLGVEMAQGWHFSKPLKVDAFIEYHQNNSVDS